MFEFIRAWVRVKLWVWRYDEETRVRQVRAMLDQIGKANG